MKRLVPLAIVISVQLWPAALPAESIFSRHDRRAAYLFVDNRGRRVGDVLTVVIREATEIDQKESRALEKKSANGNSFGFAGSWTDGAGTHAASGDFERQGASNRSFDGTADFSSQRDMADRMTVTIIDVLPNGYCVIEGLRRRVVSGEERLLRISGVVRPADVSVTNVVESRFISNFHVAYEGKGVDSAFTNQGWFSRAMNKLWPF